MESWIEVRVEGWIEFDGGVGKGVDGEMGKWLDRSCMEERVSG